MSNQREEFDYIVIGGGSGGVRSARIASTHGAKVALIEGDRLGGTCINRGCIPKKLLSYSASLGEAFDHLHGFGWQGNCGKLNWQVLKDGVAKELTRLNGIYANLLKNAGVTTITGFARFTGKDTVAVGDTEYQAKHILIATGGTPRKPTFKGGEHTLLSDDMFELEKLPEKLLVIGGGYIGLEFASIFAGLGSDTTVIHRDTLPLRGFDNDIREHILQEFSDKPRLKARMNMNIESVVPQANQFLVTFENGEQELFDIVCSAIGRDPNINQLGLEQAGVKTDDKGFIEVNENFETSTSGIYAVGDVTKTHHLTPVAITQGHYLADRLFNGKSKAYSCPPVATAVFTHPPISTVGMSEEDAIKKGYSCDIYLSTFHPLKHKLSGIMTKSMMKIIVDNKTDKLLGMHMVGEDAAEIMQGFATLFGMDATKADLDNTVAIHPTAAEEFVLMRKPTRSVG